MKNTALKMIICIITMFSLFPTFSIKATELEYINKNIEANNTEELGEVKVWVEPEVVPINEEKETFRTTDYTNENIMGSNIDIEIAPTIIDITIPNDLKATYDINTGNFYMDDLYILNNSVAPVDVALSNFSINAPFTNYITPDNLPSNLTWDNLTLSESQIYASFGIIINPEGWRTIYQQDILYYNGDNLTNVSLGSLNPNCLGSLSLITKSGRSFAETLRINVDISFSVSLTN